MNKSSSSKGEVMYVSIRNEGKLRIWELFILHKTHTAQNSFLLTHIRKGPATFLLLLCVCFVSLGITIDFFFDSSANANFP